MDGYENCLLYIVYVETIEGPTVYFTDGNLERIFVLSFPRFTCILPTKGILINRYLIFETVNIAKSVKFYFPRILNKFRMGQCFTTLKLT